MPCRLPFTQESRFEPSRPAGTVPPQEPALMHSEHAEVPSDLTPFWPMLKNPLRSECEADDARTLNIALSHIDVMLSISAAPMQQGQRNDGTVNVGASRAHSAPTESDGHIINLQIGSRNCADCLEDLSEPHSAKTHDPAPHRLPRDPIIERLQCALEAAEASDSSFRGIYADALRFAIVTRLLSQQSCKQPAAQTGRNKTGLPKWRLKQVVEYVDMNLAEPMTLADLAAAAGLSPMHFAAQFRLATGVRPHEFILRRRIERSQQLLAQSRATLVDIALSVGFQTQAHFTTVFKRFVGDTPRQWRCSNYDRGPIAADYEAA